MTSSGQDPERQADAVFTTTDIGDHHLAALSLNGIWDGGRDEMLASELADLSLASIPAYFGQSFVTFATQDDLPLIRIEIWRQQPPPLEPGLRAASGTILASGGDAMLVWSTGAALQPTALPPGRVDVEVVYPDLREVENAVDEWLRDHEYDDDDRPVFEQWTFRLSPHLG